MERPVVDIPGNSTTGSSVAVGSTTSGSIETGGDHDWFRIDLAAGQSIQVTMNGLGNAALEDPYLRIRDSNGVILYENDDSGVGRNAFIAFQASYSGVYYIDVAAWDNDPPEYNYTGDYELKVENWKEPPLATVDQIADQLTHGYWNGDSHHFAATQGGSISVNLTALAGAGQTLAREALRQWSDIIGISFVEVGTGGQITFDDSEAGASTGPVWSDGIMSSAHVNVSTAWLRDYGTTVDSYSFQTYLHEIGHALGLGHAGNYDGEARFPYDASFLNDAWPMSLMSYFAPSENSYFRDLNFGDATSGTPMLADIVAIGRLYGLSTTTRLGDTTYGFNSTAGNATYNATLYTNIAYTLFDSGGIDTLDYSGFSVSQTIDLNAGAFSNIGGQTGNVSIAIGTLIENAIGGRDNDTLIGNGANNVLNGGAGNDTVSYARATAGVTVDIGAGGAQNTIGAGTDTLIGFENLIGSEYGDRLTAGAGFTTVRGGGGNDMLVARGDGDTLFGDAGDDIFVGGAGNDNFFGGDGFDTADYSNAGGGIAAAGGATGSDRLDSIERIIGSAFDDQLGYAAVVIGGAGNDNYLAGSGQIIEAAGQGIDHVSSNRDFTLPDNVENLTLIFDIYAGAAVVPAGPMRGTGNDLDNVIFSGGGDDQLSGLGGADTLIGGGGRDTLSGGSGNDTFRDSVSGHNGDSITDFTIGDRILFTDADLASFSFSLSGSTLTYSGGALTLAGVSGALFASAAPAGGVQLSLQPTATAVHNDFNGDGRSDILWRNDGGQVSNWLSTSSGGFNNNAASLTTMGADWKVAGTGDFNGDGREDILWRQDGSGTVTEWLATASGGYAANNAATVNVGTDWHIFGVGDFNGDGRSDILWQQNGGLLIDWLGKADGGFASNSAAFATVVGTEWRIVATDDFNGDGRDDILWRKDGSGQVMDWLGTSNGGFTTNSGSTVAVGLDWHISGTGDFNGDGIGDILWRQNGGLTLDWLGTASGAFTSNSATFSTVIGTEWRVVGIGDYNGDARDDILWRQDGSGRMTDWLGTANGGFTTNAANFDSVGASNMHVQDAFLPFI